MYSWLKIENVPFPDFLNIDFFYVYGIHFYLFFLATDLTSLIDSLLHCMHLFLHQ